MKEKEADLLSHPGIFLISRWPWTLKMGRSGDRMGDEVAIPPEPRAHSQPTVNLCLFSHGLS